MKEIAKACISGAKAQVTIVIGSQWGDEGKGKLVDYLAANYDYNARYNGGANAGHTVVWGNKKLSFHLLPCGILFDNIKCLLGNGTVIHLPALFSELKLVEKENINYNGRLILSDRAPLITEMHIAADSRNESDSSNRKIGTTKRGIGPAYSYKASRVGVRIGDLKNWETFQYKYNLLRRRFKDSDKIDIDNEKELKSLQEYREILLSGNMIQDSVSLVHKALEQKKRFLIEGANGAMLDIDFGTYPYVTSSNTGVAGCISGLSFPIKEIEAVVGVAKAYTTRVGEGPFPTELKDEIGEEIRKVGGEFGATTGRPRRCGWLDIPLLRYSNYINHYTSLNITKMDVLSFLDEIKIGVRYKLNGEVIDYMPSTIEEFEKVEIEYETMKGWKADVSKCKSFKELPIECQNYLNRIEELLQVPISWVNTGAERSCIFNKLD